MASASVRLIAVIRRATPRLPSRRYGRQAVRLESDRVSAWTGILAHGRVGTLRYGLRYGHQKGAGWIIQLAPDLGEVFTFRADLRERGLVCGLTTV